MSLITSAAAAELQAESSRFVSAQRAKLQAAFTDGTGKALLDVSKMTTAHSDIDDGLVVVTDGTVFLAVTRDAFRLVTKGPDGTFTARGEFTNLLGLGLLLAAG